LTSSVPVIFDYRFYFLPLSQVFQSYYLVLLKDNKQELEFLKEHGSNNQLFLVLRKQITNIQKTDTKIQGMMSEINEIDMEFEEIKNFKIVTMGSVSQFFVIFFLDRRYFSY
jgi:hypothetical protein